MKLLAFDTSTESLSIAAQHGARVAAYAGAGGTQASAGLIPALRQVLIEVALSLDELDALVFGRGPGSFTGVRTACSVVQGLGFGARGGAGLPVLPVDSLLAVAEDARHRHGCTRVVAVLDARMDEVYVAQYVHDAGRWNSQGGCAVCAPESVVVPPGWTVAGNAHAVYGERLAPHAPQVPARPEAAALLRLAPVLLAQGLAVAAGAALPLYVRDKVAQTTAERSVRAACSGASKP
ncbi:MAG: tRNA (adenosine(37)-N6)-threonylcarbamoyltransferase complex dimerization subunit type 1 TsaB [Burkholderiaceae bacterium]|nr:tRNA (adenosine(37)-N6)-threonylcarbamoyltransferase complex dimerization subunit type 1 TsaB [Burkholderiaceae bacterium]